MVKGGRAIYKTQAGPAYGGAVYSASTLTATDSSFVGNQTFAGDYAMNDSHNGVIGAMGYGGAIYNSGTALLNRCSVYSNYVQGGIGHYASPAYSGIGGDALGGGIFNALQFAATNCTVVLNSVVGGDTLGGPYLTTNGNAWGGGVFNNTNATFIAMNLTIASNSCSSPPSGHRNNGDCTNGFAAGAQIANTNGTLHLHNSLIAYGGTNSNAYGTITDDGYNICSDGSANLNSGSSYNFTDPKLGPLADNGGPTLCMALLSNSPAIDFGDSSGSPNTDQRGFVRPFGDGVDMGAYEYGSFQQLGSPVGVPGYLSLNTSANYYLLSFTTAAATTWRLQTSTNLITWNDLNTNGPFVSPTNVCQIFSRKSFDHSFFRLLMQ